MILLGIFISLSQLTIAQECKFGIFSIPEKIESADKQIKTFPLAYPQLNENEETTVKTPAAIDLDDIKKTEIQDKNIILHFTYKGAKKWVQFTKDETGNQIAFVVNNKIYSIPKVNAQIKIGMAMISGLKDKQEAMEVNKFLIKE